MLFRLFVPIRLRFDETTCKKTGRKIEGCSTYRNGAGSARQEYRTIEGFWHSVMPGVWLRVVIVRREKATRLGASQVLWFAREVEQQSTSGLDVALRPYQPWYEKKQKPSLHDIAWAVRERLLLEGITPRVGIWEGMGVIHRLRSEKGADQMPRAA